MPRLLIPLAAILALVTSSCSITPVLRESDARSLPWVQETLPRIHAIQQDLPPNEARLLITALIDDLAIDVDPDVTTQIKLKNVRILSHDQRYLPSLIHTIHALPAKAPDRSAIGSWMILEVHRNSLGIWYLIQAQPLPL